MDALIQLLGRFHPLVVHLPIGFLLLAFIFECLAFIKRYSRLRAAVQPALFIGSLAAVGACLTGYLLKQEGGYEDEAVNLHQNLGIATAISAVLLYWLRTRLAAWLLRHGKPASLRIALFMPLVVLLSAAGHWGGSLTHGDEYLAFDTNDNDYTRSTWPIDSLKDPQTAVLYKDVIAPLLEARCYSCHSARKQKGQLRLDGALYIGKGGKHGAVLMAGVPDSSSLYSRLLLAPEDEHHMPPKDKPQLTAAEVALLAAWIKGGASYDMPVAAFTNATGIIGNINASRTVAPAESWIPEGTPHAADAMVLAQLKAAGVIVLPAGIDTQYLTVNFVNSRQVNDTILSTLVRLKEQVVWLNLGFSYISDAQLQQVGALENLRVLYLNNTKVTDAGITRIGNLRQLRYLNLVGTAASDACLTTLSGMTALKHVYLYQTRMSGKGIREYLRLSKDVMADTGNYMLQMLATDTITYKRKI